MSLELLWFGLFILLGFSTQIATGFGANLIAIALGALVLPIETMLPILVTLNVFISSITISQEWKQIHFATLLKIIMPLMLSGMLVGILLLDYLSNNHLKKGFALLILWFSIRESYKLYREVMPSAKGWLWQSVWTFIAGITHGLFASGGPLLVYSLSRTTLTKSQFRTTLLATWWGLNLSYTLVFWQRGVLENHYVQIIYYVPVLVAAIVVGQMIHNRINEILFKKVIYVLLAICAVVMLAS